MHSESQLHSWPLWKFSPHRPLQESSICAQTRKGPTQQTRTIRQHGAPYILITCIVIHKVYQGSIWNVAPFHGWGIDQVKISGGTCISGEKSLTCGALRFVVFAALSVGQAGIITLARVTPVVLSTTSSFAARCWLCRAHGKSIFKMSGSDVKRK